SAILNRALLGAILIAVIVFLPDGVAGGLSRWGRRAATKPSVAPAQAAAEGPRGGVAVPASAPLLVCAAVKKAFRGLQALAGVTLEVRGRRDPRPHRTERLGQVDADQCGERLLSERRRANRARRSGYRARPGSPHRESWSGPGLSDPPLLS